MYLDRKYGLSLSLSEFTLLFDISLYLDLTLAQRKAQRKAKSKVKVAQWMTYDFPGCQLDVGLVVVIWFDLNFSWICFFRELLLEFCDMYILIFKNTW